LLSWKTTLIDYVTEMIARFVVGDADINKEWDAYLAELDKIGIDRYLEIMQKAYDDR
jgi:putative aldouronate transport system substrate-binding protein